MLWDKEVAIARLYIVGAGPAGISAAIWAKRLGWDPIILERTRCLGGQLNEFTLPIVDLPGQPDVLATELAHALDEQLQRLGVGIEYGCQVVGFSDLRLIFADGGSVESSIFRCIAILAVAAEVPASLIERARRLRHAKGLVSLVWKSGFSMQVAVLLQTLLCDLPPASLLSPKPGGGFPLTAEEMHWQIDFLSHIVV